MLVELSEEQLNLVVQGLLTAACVSREHGHNEQADDFGRVRQSVSTQAEAARVKDAGPRFLDVKDTNICPTCGNPCEWDSATKSVCCGARARDA